MPPTKNRGFLSLGASNTISYSKKKAARGGYLSQLLNAVRILLLEVIGIAASIDDRKRCFPVKLFLGFVARGVILGDVPGATRQHLIRNLDAIRGLEGMDKF